MGDSRMHPFDGKCPSTDDINSCYPILAGGFGWRPCSLRCRRAMQEAEEGKSCQHCFNESKLDALHGERFLLERSVLILYATFA